VNDSPDPTQTAAEQASVRVAAAAEEARLRVMAHQHHLLQQAPVPAMDADGVVVVAVGTILFAVASVVLAIFYSALARAGEGWWLWVGIGGLALGLFGIWYCLNRQRRRRAGRWSR
jgi:hypothetical protein